MLAVQITDDNPALQTLRRSWVTSVYSDHDGLAPMGSLHEAGDALVALSLVENGSNIVLGSGVMIAPGLVVAATHVLDEFKARDASPIIISFLPSGMRAWLPHESSTASGRSAFDVDRKVVSDICLVSCSLNSEAHSELPLTLAPVQIALPLRGERLWAFGYRHEAIEDGAALITPLVSTGLVTEVFPSGRGERMRSACIEVAMDAKGGMSGGPVVNSKGNLIGIVSSSFDGGPTYVTLMWDALRYKFVSRLPSMASWGELDIIAARNHGLVRLVGDIHKSKIGDITYTMTDAEVALLTETADPTTVTHTPEGTKPIVGDELEDFLEDWLSDIESAASAAALTHLNGLRLPHAQAFLSLSNVPRECLQAVHTFSAEDFEGVEDPDVRSVRIEGDGRVAVAFAFDLLSVRWTATVPTMDYKRRAEDFEAAFLNVDVGKMLTTFELLQRCHFEAKLTLDQHTRELLESQVTFAGAFHQREDGRKRIVSWYEEE